jgi:two-component system sensor histidine kinase KdpD
MHAQATGKLRIYLGASAGVGKTYTMLGDARVAQEDGADIVLGYLEPHGRARTEQQAHGLEAAPLIDLTGRRADLGVDVDWLLTRAPSIALVDELAHTNVAGSARPKRHLDIDALLAAGIDVWTTVNVQHLETLNDRVAQLVGVRVRETFPDRYLHDADEIRLIDISPDALRERIGAGLVYGTERIETALNGFFSIRNLTALRALALHEMAENAARQLAALDALAPSGGTQREPNRGRAVERVLAAVGGRLDTIDRVLRVAARMSRRSSGELLVLYVKPPGVRVDARTIEAISHAAQLTASLGGVFLERESDDAAAEIVREAQAQGVTQLVLGASDRTRLRAAFSPSPIDAIMRTSDGIDLYIVSRPARPASGGGDDR